MKAYAEGDLVTVKEDFISDTCCGSYKHDCPHKDTNRRIMIRPGMVGIIANPKVPTVRPPLKYFMCVDFIVGECSFRIRPYPTDVKRLKDAERPVAHKFCGVWMAGEE